MNKYKNALIVLLAVFNVMLLFKYYSRSEDRQVEETDWSKIEIVHPNLKKKDFRKQTILILPQSSCMSCLISEIDLINRYLDKIDTVYFWGSQERFLEENGARFPYETLDTYYNVLNGVTMNNPVALVFDDSGRLIKVHKAEIANKQKSIDFYKQL